MAGRAAVLAWEEAKAANPCILADHQGHYEYGGMQYDLVSHPAGASFQACSTLVQLVLRQNLECGAPQVGAPASLTPDASRALETLPQNPPETPDNKIPVLSRVNTCPKSPCQ